MNTFVIVFRRCPPALADSDRQRLNEQTAAWARVHNASGHKLEPRILAAEAELRGPEVRTAARPNDWSLSALLFLDARDLTEATQVAESHPALNYGFNVEVRPWAAPATTLRPGGPAATTAAEPA